MDKKKLLRNLIGWPVYIALLAGLVYGTPKALAFFLKTPHPMASITSGSMWPALKKGDLVFIKGVETKEEIEIGDIVVYSNPKGFTIHRVIDKKEKTVATKGDANNVEDLPVQYEEIVGKALEFKGRLVKIPFLGNISLLLGKYET